MENVDRVQAHRCPERARPEQYHIRNRRQGGSARWLDSRGRHPTGDGGAEVHGRRCESNIRGKYYRCFHDGAGLCEGDDSVWAGWKYCADCEYERDGCEQSTSLLTACGSM